MKTFVHLFIALVYCCLLSVGAFYLYTMIDKETCIAKGAIMQRDISWQWQTGCMVKTRSKLNLTPGETWVPLNSLVINE